MNESNTNNTHPQEGNQIVIGTNSGTINMYNTDRELVKSIIEVQQAQEKTQQLLLDVIQKASDELKKQLEKQNQNEPTKQNRRRK